MGEGFPPSVTAQAPCHLPRERGRKRDIWPDMLRAAVAMGIGPEAFWRLSWREWRMLCGGGVGAVLERGALDEMMARFPDGAK